MGLSPCWHENSLSIFQSWSTIQWNFLQSCFQKWLLPLCFFFWFWNFKIKEKGKKKRKRITFLWSIWFLSFANTFGPTAQTASDFFGKPSALKLSSATPRKMFPLYSKKYKQKKKKDLHKLNFLKLWILIFFFFFYRSINAKFDEDDSRIIQLFRKSTSITQSHCLICFFLIDWFEIVNLNQKKKWKESFFYSKGLISCCCSISHLHPSRFCSKSRCLYLFFHLQSHFSESHKSLLKVLLWKALHRLRFSLFHSRQSLCWALFRLLFHLLVFCSHMIFFFWHNRETLIFGYILDQFQF